MKKLIVTLLAVLTCGAAYTLPVGNPAEASLLCDGLFWEGSCCLDPCDPCATWCDAISFRIGYYGDFVFNRHLELDASDGDDIEDTEIFTNAGYIALNIWDRVDVFGTLGATNIWIDTNAITFSNAIALNGQRFELETETNFSWSIGARATVWECGCTAIGIEGQYFSTCLDVNRVTIAATTSVYPDDSVDMHYCEWQVGLGVAHRINMLVPYAAVKWAGAKACFDNAVILENFPVTGNTVTLFDLENKKCWGYAVGVSLVDCEKAALTVEGRWADEKAVYVNGQFRF